MKRYINTALYFEQLKRFWPIAAIAMLGYLLFIVQPLFSPSFYHAEHTTQSILHIMSMRDPILIFAMVAVPFFTALALFSYPYRVASTTAFHSFPVNRMQLFFTQGFAGLTLMLAPLFLLTLILLVPINFASSRTVFDSSVGFPLIFGRSRILVGEVINTVPRMAGFFLRNALGFTMHFAVFTLAASIAGNRVIAVLLSGVFSFTPMALVGLSGVIGSFYIFGFGLAPFSPVETVGIYTHPGNWAMVFGGFTTVWPQMNGGGGQFAFSRSLAPFFISYGLITLATFGLAFLAYRLRPQERAGDTVAFLPVKRVLIFLFALAGMVVLGIFWLNVSGSRFLMYIGFVVGFVIAYFIAQMIAEKSFRIGHKIKHVVTYGAVALGLYAMLLLVTGLGFWGYVRRVPQAEEITGVFIEQTFRRDARGGLRRENHFFIDDPATITQVRELHEYIVEERRYFQQVRWGDAGLRVFVLGGGTIPLSITYQLANGSMVHRSYVLPSAFHHRHSVISLLASGPVMLSHSPALAQPEVIEFISFEVSLEQAWTFHQEFDQARIDADAQGVTVEDILGERAFILNFVFHDWPDVRTPHQVAQLAEAIQLDILSRDTGFDWNNVINISLRIRNQYVTRNWGRTWFQVPIDGYSARWLIDNGFIPEDME